MKKIQVILIFSIIALALVLIGCDEAPSSGNFKNFALNMSNYNGIQWGNCRHEYRFKFDDSGTFYYWVGFLDGNGNIAFVSSKFLGSGTTGSRTCSANLTYTWKLPSGTYNARLFKMRGDDDLADTLGSIGPVSVFVTNYQRQDCDTSCCSRPYYSFNQYSERVFDYPQGVTGASATIDRSTAKLCNETPTTSPAFSLSYLNLTRQTSSNGRLHTQIGYGFFRNVGGPLAGGGIVHEAIYLEILHGGAQFLDYQSVSASQTENALEMKLDAQNSTWDFFVNGQFWTNMTYLPWSVNPDSLRFGCEIRNWEDDMMGTQTSPIALKSCRGFDPVQSGWFNINFTYSTPNISDSTEWMNVIVSSDEIAVWDLDRIP